MTFLKFVAEHLPLLTLVMLALLVTTLLHGDREGRHFSHLLFHSTSLPDAACNHCFNASDVPKPQDVVTVSEDIKSPANDVTQGTNYSRCIQTTTKETVYDRQRVQEEQLKRRAHLQDACISEIVNLSDFKLNRKHYLIDRSRQILYCWIHKVASTSWISFMARLRGLQVRKNRIYREISRLSASSDEEVQTAALNYRVRFIVVRHPFLRLISAYRDRIWAATQKYSAQALIYVPRILRLTRPHLSQFHSSSIIRKNSRKLAIVPTFEEFVQYLLVSGNVSSETHSNQSRKAAFDVHWVPYYQHCSVCSIPFNIIIKLETIEDDKNYMMEELGLKTQNMKGTEGTINEPSTWTPENENNDKMSPKKQKANSEPISIDLLLRKGGNMTYFYPTTEKTEKAIKFNQSVTTKLHHLQISNIGPSCPCYYFSQLTNEQLQGLTKIYEKDLKIFGYSTEEYKKCLR
ncbi:carbohydrate sulfotransferase 10-like [Ischnura elegans]|uniref:carbohydrate sulfotransferase 10-like n=1 Tax=Ischnura elegans TaxID=197161 RepID=UPI001ED8AA4E|nr:carbohydrate sulfotransferase 10-like [Ischnura elegans]